MSDDNTTPDSASSQDVVAEGDDWIEIDLSSAPVNLLSAFRSSVAADAEEIEFTWDPARVPPAEEQARILRELAAEEYATIAAAEDAKRAALAVEERVETAARWQAEQEALRAAVADPEPEGGWTAVPDAERAAQGSDGPPMTEQPVEEFVADPGREARLQVMRDRIIRSDEPHRVAPPSWLVHKVLEDRKINLLVGAPNAGKSFLAMDFACRVALGDSEWCGYEIRRSGPVLYLAAEGWPGLFYRKAAWEAFHGRSVGGGIHFYDRPVPVVESKRENGRTELRMSRDWEDFTAIAAEIQPAAVMVDTRGKVSIANPDRPEEMTPVIRGLEEFIDVVGCSLIVIDHSPRAGLRPRGDQIFEGSTASVLVLDKTSKVEGKATADDVYIEVINYRQRDGRQQDPLDFRLTDVQVEGREDRDAVLVQGAPDWVEERRRNSKGRSADDTTPGFQLILDNFSGRDPFSFVDYCKARRIDAADAKEVKQARGLLKTYCLAGDLLALGGRAKRVYRIAAEASAEELAEVGRTASDDPDPE